MTDERVTAAAEVRAVSSLEEIEREQRSWRERVLVGIATTTASVAVFATGWFWIGPTKLRVLAPMVGLSLVATAFAALARRAPFTARVSALLLAIYVPCTYVMWLAGYTPNSTLGFALVAVTATLLVGQRAGLAVVLAGALTVLTISLAQHAGIVARVPTWQAEVDSSEPYVTLRVTVIFALFAATIVIGVRYLLDRAERLALDKAQSLERLRAEQAERERIAKDLERREAAFQKARELEILGRLAGSMAHDFNNALLVILGSLDELEGFGPLPEPMRAALEAIRSASNQAAATTRQLHAFGPAALGKVAELQLAPLLTKAQKMLARVLPMNIELRCDIQVDARIDADEGEVLRILTNLSLNARDAMRDGGTLVLRLRPPRNGEQLALDPSIACVAIDVEDTGTGMADEVKTRLFEPFFTTKQASGTGLGLASVREIVENHRGCVSVSSTLGAGTTLSLLWPLAQTASSSDAPAVAQSQASPLTVLLVDDDDAVRATLQRSLERAGVTVLEAADGNSALLAARRHRDRIDALCTDCFMPGLPVVELIHRFREIHDGRVIVCSGYLPAETGLSPADYDAVLCKPFSADALCALVQRPSQNPTSP